MPTYLTELNDPTLDKKLEILKKKYLEVLIENKCNTILQKIETIEKSDRCFEFYGLLGEIADGKDKFDESVIFYTAAIAAAKQTKPGLYAKRATAYFKLGRYQQVIEDYEAAYHGKIENVIQAIKISYSLDILKRHAEIPAFLLPFKNKLAALDKVEKESFYWLLASADFACNNCSLSTIHYLEQAAVNSETDLEKAKCFKKIGYIFEVLMLRLKAITAYEQAQQFSPSYAIQAKLHQKIYHLALQENILDTALTHSGFFKSKIFASDKLLYLSAMLLQQGNTAAAKLFLVLSAIVESACDGKVASKETYAELDCKIQKFEWLDCDKIRAIYDFLIGKTTKVTEEIIMLSAKACDSNTEYFRGLELFDQRDFAGATAIFHKINSYGGLAHDVLAEIYCAQQDSVNAILCYTQGIEILSTFSATGRARYYYARSKLFEVLGFFDCALDDLQVAINNHDEADPISINELQTASVALLSKNMRTVDVKATTDSTNLHLPNADGFFGHKILNSLPTTFSIQDETKDHVTTCHI